jgi:hypothetical protein
MSIPNALCRPATILLVLSVSACARPVQRAEGPRPGTPLERVEELPATPTDAGGAAPGASFAQACAMRLRDPSSGRDYLLLRSNIRRTVAGTDTVTTSALASAVGDYGPMSAGRGAGRPATEIRVDCITSRVLAILDRGT